MSIMIPPSLDNRHSYPASVIDHTDIKGLCTLETWNTMPLGSRLPGVQITWRFCPSFTIVCPLANSYSSQLREAGVLPVLIENNMDEGSMVSPAPESTVISVISQP